MDCLQRNPKYPRSMLLDDVSEPDYISKLPDDILILIIDKLPMEEAMNTSLLSKRWKDMWKYKRIIELGYAWFQKTGKKVLPSLFKIFSALKEQDIHRISVSLRYGRSMLTKIQYLITYAINRRVEELDIDFNGRKDNRLSWRRRYPFVSIPEHEFDLYSSLVKLSLKSLQLETLPPSCFIALNELFLERVKLGEDSVEKITNNCPSLGLLCLCNCNPKTKLRVIIATNSNLVHLVIREDMTEVKNTTELCIRPANVKAIEFGLALPRKEYRMVGTLVCSEATFRLNQMHHSRQAMRVTGSGIKGRTSKNFVGLLKKLRAAKVLTLCSWCIQVLSVEVVKSASPIIFDSIHLTLEMGLIIWEFWGIVYLLMGCHKLENLVVIKGNPSHLNFSALEKRMMSFAKSVTEFDNILPVLETMEIKNSSGKYVTEDDKFNEDQFFDDFKYGKVLVIFLKTFAGNLKKVIYTTGNKRYET